MRLKFKLELLASFGCYHCAIAGLAEPNSNLRRFGVSRSHEDAKKTQRSLFRVDYV